MTAQQIEMKLADAGITENQLVSLTFGRDEIEVLVVDEDGYARRVATDRLRGEVCKILGWEVWNVNETRRGASRVRPGIRPEGVYYMEIDADE